jgi:transposase
MFNPERILAYGNPVDMRKSFNGLLGVVREHVQEDPLSGTFYVFINRSGNYLKGIYWDRTGYCLYAKRLVRGRFRFPLGTETQELNEQVFKLLLDGIVVGKWS